jgi:two-component system, cell cycle response regulator
MLRDATDAETPRRVLVVDDAQEDRQLVRAQLRSDPLELLEADDGPSGLAAARRERPDLILLDVSLPGCDGFELIRHLKDDPQTRSIPVIFLSAATTRDMAQGLDLGAVDFVSKPSDPIELRARVRAALRTKALQDMLEQRAHLDGLTGLGNRHALEERLDIEWSTCQRRAQPLAVLIADLDHFKRINDLHGHSAGDEILRRAALTLRGSVRAGDFVGRYGGEEFVVIAPDCDLLGAVTMAERFRAAFAGATVEFHGRPIPATASAGVASALVLAEPRRPSHQGPASPGAEGSAIAPAPRQDGAFELLGRADRALYRAKSAGRNAVWAWDDTLRLPVAATSIMQAIGAGGGGMAIGGTSR